MHLVCAIPNVSPGVRRRLPPHTAAGRRAFAACARRFMVPRAPRTATRAPTGASGSALFVRHGTPYSYYSCTGLFGQDDGKSDNKENYRVGPPMVDVTCTKGV
jgi:hypothetical protein